MNLGTLVSETRNPQTMDLDALPTPELVKRFNEQDTLVAEAVKATLPDVARAVDAAAAASTARATSGRVAFTASATSVSCSLKRLTNSGVGNASRSIVCGLRVSDTKVPRFIFVPLEFLIHNKRP